MRATSTQAPADQRRALPRLAGNMARSTNALARRNLLCRRPDRQEEILAGARRCECHPDVETCFARFAERGVGERWQASMEGLVVGLTGANGRLVRYDEDWHLD